MIMSPRNPGQKRGKKMSDDGYGENDDYRKKRARNNEAVKKSRVKSKLRTQETLERVEKLKVENGMLEEKIQMLSKELDFLKEMLFASTGTSVNGNIDAAQAEMLLRAISRDDKPEASNIMTTTSGRRGRKSSLEERRA